MASQKIKFELVDNSKRTYVDFTYECSKEACLRSRRFLIEIMHGHSIYENQIGTFSVVQNQSIGAVIVTSLTGWFPKYTVFIVLDVAFSLRLHAPLSAKTTY
jgi:hypothetical protein